MPELTMDTLNLIGAVLFVITFLVIILMFAEHAGEVLSSLFQGQE